MNNYSEKHEILYRKVIGEFTITFTYRDSLKLSYYVNISSITKKLDKQYNFGASQTEAETVYKFLINRNVYVLEALLQE